MATKRFHRYFPTKGYDLYWILFAYLAIGYFYPVIGLLALICMIAPVAFAVKRGRWWCGNACPSIVKILTSPPHSEIRPHYRLPFIHGIIHIYNVWRADVFCFRRLECYGSCVLEHHSCHNYRRGSAVIHIRPSHMVLILPDGNTVIMGIAKETTGSERIYKHTCR